MSFFFTEASNQLARGNLDFSGGHDMRVLLFTTGSTVTVDGPTGKDAVTIAAITGLNEYLSPSYARQALEESVVKSDANNRTLFDAIDTIFSGLLLDDQARQAIGLLIYRHIGADSANIPICVLDNAPLFPFFANGGNVILVWSGTGIIEFRGA